MKNKIKKEGSVRIISGALKGRKIRFPDNEKIRPTPDRIKETLFNWLSTKVKGADCLDLYAGSGSLGFEAASRGAKTVTMVEKDEVAIKALRQNKEEFKLKDIKIEASDVFIYLAYLKGTKFDIIFLDPPFKQGILAECLESIQNYSLLKDSSLIYVESESELKDLPLPTGWKVCSSKRAGNVAYCLLSKI